MLKLIKIACERAAQEKTPAKEFLKRILDDPDVPEDQKLLHIANYENN